MSISETDEDKVIEFIEKEYEHWAFNWPHKFNKFKFMKDDGTTCRDSKS